MLLADPLKPEDLASRLPAKLLSALIVEDCDDDFFFILHNLRRAGYAVNHARVQTASDLRAALAARTWDIVLADYQLPMFDGLQALAVVRQQDPDVPFILVSGKVSEDLAVEAMRAGAQDYLSKASLTRLAPAIDRELKEASVRRAQRRTDVEFAAAKQRLETLPSYVIEIQETDRRRIVRALQNQVGEPLVSLRMELRTLLRDAGDQNVACTLSAMDDALSLALNQLRDLALRLRPPQLEELGLRAALHWLLEQASGGGPRITLLAAPDLPRLPAMLETTCFRLTQEAIENALRHADASEIIVSLTHDPETIELSVRDDGVGFDLATVRRYAMRGDYLGIQTMEQLTALAGGKLEIESRPAQGTTVSARFSLQPNEPAT